MSTEAWSYLVVLLSVSVVSVVSAQREDGVRTRLPTNRQQRVCTQPQSNIDLRELLGLWNVIEVIEHSERYTDRRNTLRAISRSDSCPVVHFALDGEREVRMLWNDESGYLQYTFKMPNVNNPGFWVSETYQSGKIRIPLPDKIFAFCNVMKAQYCCTYGTLSPESNIRNSVNRINQGTVVDSHYEHFSGTAQVMKAVQSHMVLTFCSPLERHFSIILARAKYLSHDEVSGVHNQLKRVNLPLVAVQSFCRNAGMSATPSALLAALLAVLVCTTQLSF